MMALSPKESPSVNSARRREPCNREHLPISENKQHRLRHKKEKCRNHIMNGWQNQMGRKIIGIAHTLRGPLEGWAVHLLKGWMDGDINICMCTRKQTYENH